MQIANGSSSLVFTAYSINHFICVADNSVVVLDVHAPVECACVRATWIECSERRITRAGQARGIN